VAGVTLARRTLEGRIVRLEPLHTTHSEALSLVGCDGRLWRHQPKAIETAVDMAAYVDLALREQAEGRSLPFVILRQPEGLVIGSTRFMDIALEHRRLEIGATWVAPAFQRTGANVEAKLLMLANAFESLGVQKVVFKTEVLNEQSRRAIDALGAVHEGTFRKHLLTDRGRPRDMLYFSILDDEWPDVRKQLLNRLARHH
jgi:N-acetyltransferase